MLTVNPFTVPLSHFLVAFLNQQTSRLRMKPFTIKFFIANNRINYHLKGPTRAIKNSFTFDQFALDLKSLGGCDTNNLVYVNQIAALYFDCLPLIIEDYVIFHLNAEARDVLRDPQTTTTRTSLDTNYKLTFTINIIDPVSRSAFENLIHVTSLDTFRLAPDQPIEQFIVEDTPNYQLTLKIDLNA